MSALASARCLDRACDWSSERAGLALLGGEAQSHADSTGHGVSILYTIPARAGCDPVSRCVCTSDDFDRTPCPVHGR